MRVVVGIGANLGDRLAMMREAVRRVGETPGLTVVARSRVYETEPVGGVPQGMFLNAAILVECTLSPNAILAALQQVEVDLGRVRGPTSLRWGPRTIDLDVLWIDGVVVDERKFTVPHAALLERSFALIPLLDVAPDALDPNDGVRYDAKVTKENAGVRATSLAW